VALASRAPWSRPRSSEAQGRKSSEALSLRRVGRSGLEGGDTRTRETASDGSGHAYLGHETAAEAAGRGERVGSRHEKAAGAAGGGERSGSGGREWWR
jgi:hypothetical protein